MKIYRVCLAGMCLLLLLATGCSTAKISATVVPQSVLKPLPAASKLYVAMPKNYSHNGKTIPTSSKHCIEAFQQGVRDLPLILAYADILQPHDTAMAQARQAGSSYMVSIEILDWSEPNSIFSTKDRGEILVTLYDTENGIPIRADNVSCRGTAKTIAGFGVHSPKDCLHEGFRQWAELIFSKRSAKQGASLPDMLQSIEQK